MLVFATVFAFALAPAAGCGLDDTVIGVLGSSDAGDASLTNDSSPDLDTGPVEACAPKTCTNYPEDCHTALDDGCGKTIDCSSACAEVAQACVIDGGVGRDAGFFCDGPPVCKDAGEPGGNCGEIVNPGNGLDASCGTCTNSGYSCASATCSCIGTTCGASCCNGGTPDCNGTNNTCCKLKTCLVDYAGMCSATNSDGCGGNLDCSGACGAQVCDTSNHNCCSPDSMSTTCSGHCNTVQNNCHQNVSCGAGCPNGFTCQTTTCACTSGKICGGTCCGASTDECKTSDSSCCIPDLKTVTCLGKCGDAVPDNCGQPTDCGSSCNTDDLCGGGTCNCGGSATCSSGQLCCSGTTKCQSPPACL